MLVAARQRADRHGQGCGAQIVDTDAIARALWRSTVSRRGLLQWTTAAAAESAADKHEVVGDESVIAALGASRSGGAASASKPIE